MVNPYQRFLEPQVLAELSGLELRTQRIVDGVLSGRNRSRARGMSNEFVQHREYTPGDDVRRIDWRVYGRTDKYQLKQFEDESNLVLYLVLDTSESMSYQGPGSPLSKLDFAKCLIAAMAWIAQRSSNAVGLILFDETIRMHRPPSTDPICLAETLTQLESAASNAKTNFEHVQNEIIGRLEKKGIVYMVSDFFDSPERVVTTLRALRHCGHDVIAQQILDPAEIQFPFRKTTRFRGLETRNDIVLSPQRIRRGYLKKLNAFHKVLRRGCTEARVEFRQNNSTENFGAILSSFLETRMRFS